MCVFVCMCMWCVRVRACVRVCERVRVCVRVCDAQFLQIMLKLRGSTMMRLNHEFWCSGVCVCVCVRVRVRVHVYADVCFCVYRSVKLHAS